MKPSLPLVATLSTLVLLSPVLAHAETETPQPKDMERQSYESGGVLAGMAVGALAGGPLGALVTAAAGGWFGNVVHDAKTGKLARAELLTAQQELFALQQSNTTLQQQNLALGEKLEQSNLLASTGKIAAATTNCCANTLLTLHFRSASTAVENHYQQTLKEFAELAKAMPDATVEINGHADRRGDTAANLALSAQRVQAVESALRKLGLTRVRYATKAQGELQPLSMEDSLESNFFDRRVQVALRGKDGALLSLSRP